MSCFLFMTEAQIHWCDISFKLLFAYLNTIAQRIEKIKSFCYANAAQFFSFNFDVIKRQYDRDFSFSFYKHEIRFNFPCFNLFIIFKFLDQWT